MTEAQFISNKNSIQFYDIDKLYFPKICIVCGNKTDNTIQKLIAGKFTYVKNNKKDYQLNIPVCKDCYDKSRIQKSKESIKVIIPSIIGLITSLILYFFTLSIFISVAIITFLTIIPLLIYRSKVSKKIDLDKYIRLNSKSLDKNAPEDILELEFLSESYAEYLSKLNLEQNENLTKVKGFKSKNTIEETNYISCQNCNASIPSDKKFCTVCGTKLGMQSKEDIKDIKISKIPMDKPEAPFIGKSQPFNTATEIEMNSQLESIKQEHKEFDKSSKIICPHCHKSLPPDSYFCTFCGKSIKETQKSSENYNPISSSLISKDSFKQPIKCSNCGQFNSSGLNFCTKCGFKL